MESSRTSLALRTSSRKHFEVLGLEASSPRKLPCPRLEDSTIFEPLKFRWKTPETLRKICKDLFFWFSQVEIARKNFWKTFFPGDRIKNFFKTFFWRTFAPVFWPLASNIPVLDLERVCSRKGYPWP